MRGFIARFEVPLRLHQPARERPQSHRVHRVVLVAQIAILAGLWWWHRTDRASPEAPPERLEHPSHVTPLPSAEPRRADATRDRSSAPGERFLAPAR